MEITYIGHSCFTIKGKELTIVTDPYDSDMVGFKMPKLKADVVTISHHHGDHDNVSSVSDYNLVIDNPGEFETNSVFIYGLSTFHDDKQGTERGKNTVYLIEIDGFSILHLGDLGHELNKDTLEKIAKVDVLLIPVGGTYTINAQTATKVISSLEPAIVVPMHYQVSGSKFNLDGVDKFLDEMGVEDHKQLNKLVLTKQSDIPEETEVVVLNPSH